MSSAYYMTFESEDSYNRHISKVERDAALAAVERVRVAKHEVDSVHQIHGADCLCGYSSARSRSRTEHITEAMLAALDGAPEPEWEWGYRGETLIDVHPRKSRESAEGAVKDLTEYWALHGKKFEVVRRRKAGPWEPVEGEKP